MNLVENRPLFSTGHPLDTSDEAFGELRDSSYQLGNAETLRTRMQEEGYLYVRGFFKREDVIAARAVIVERLMAESILKPGTDPLDAVINPGQGGAFRPDLSEKNAPLQALLYQGALMEFYGDFFGEPALHFDFTWMRVMATGNGTLPHCDVVYMGRGEREKLLTAWVPLGDAPISLGGLMILEGSNNKHELLRPYLERDVDSYCTNGRHAPEIEGGKKAWEWDGSLSKDPVSLRNKLGGRWLTTDFEAGDLLTFTVHTVHASTDNQTDRLRLSSDSRYQPASRPADERWMGEKPIGHSLAGKRGRIC